MQAGAFYCPMYLQTRLLKNCHFQKGFNLHFSKSSFKMVNFCVLVLSSVRRVAQLLEGAPCICTSCVPAFHWNPCKVTCGLEEKSFSKISLHISGKLAHIQIRISSMLFVDFSLNRPWPWFLPIVLWGKSLFCCVWLDFIFFGDVSFKKKLNIMLIAVRSLRLSNFRWNNN